MEENTLTFTARETENPEKVATFTLQNGDVAVQLGNAMLTQVVDTSESKTEQSEEDVNLVDWTKAAAVGAAQKALHTMPIYDFDADLNDQKFHTTAWIRTGGLRAVPMSVTWDEVDNPEAARAFVKEVNERKKMAPQVNKMPSILDYWASWIVVSVSGLVFMVTMLRLLKRFQSDDKIENQQ
jgi:hypothetical protein